MSQSGVCNTIKTPSHARNRHFCLTINNFTQEHKEKLLKNCDEYVFQEETGSNGTPHLQCLISFKNGKTFSTIKKLFPTAHIEVCKDIIASVKYCSKQETRTGEVYISPKYQTIALGEKLKPKKFVMTQEEIEKQAAELTEETLHKPEIQKVFKMLHHTGTRLNKNGEYEEFLC